MEDDADSMLDRLASGYRVLTTDGRDVGVLEVDRGSHGTRLHIRQRRLLRHRRIPLPALEIQVVNAEDEIVVLRIGSEAFDRRVAAAVPASDPDATGHDVENRATVPEGMDDSIAPLETRVAVDAGAEAGADSSAPPEGDDARSHYLLFVGTATGYTLLEHDAKPGVVGAVVELREFPETEFRITKLAPSPLPLDERRCAYLQPVR
jgi:hypothetical protein